MLGEGLDSPYDGRHTAPGLAGVTSAGMNRPASEHVPQGDLPLGQRLFDNIYLLLVAGVLIVFALYTGWGLWEILSLPPSPLR